MNIYSIEIEGCDGIDEVIHVAANNREEAVEVLTASHNVTWYNVMWIEGASYETDKPCEITTRLCTKDGEII